MIWSSHLEVGRLRFSTLVEYLGCGRIEEKRSYACTWFTELGIQLHFAVVSQFFSL